MQRLTITHMAIWSKSSLVCAGKGLIHPFVPVDMSYMSNESCCSGANNQTSLITVVNTEEITNFTTTATAIFCLELSRSGGHWICYWICNNSSSIHFSSHTWTFLSFVFFLTSAYSLHPPIKIPVLNVLLIHFCNCMHDVIQVNQNNAACCKKRYTCILLQPK